MKTTAKYFSIKNSISITFVLISFLIVNCTGPEGPMGPQGEKGLDGAPGNANVVSIQYEVQSTQWKGDTNGYKAILSVPEITSAIYDHGAVLVYMLNEQDPNHKYFNMLPYTYVNNSAVEYMDFDAYVGQINLSVKWTDNGVNSTLVPNSTEIFKIIIAEGTALSVLKENVNVANYQAVSEYFGLTQKNTIVY
jgi:hypothetical protein